MSASTNHGTTAITGWFNMAHILSELFLELKLDILGDEVIAIQQKINNENCGGGDEYPFQLDSNLRKLPEVFEDSSHEFVENIYTNLPSGYDDTSDYRHNNKQVGCEEEGGGNPFLYGELSTAGCRQIYRMICKMSLQSKFPADETIRNTDRHAVTFVDIGSGVGRLAMELSHLSGVMCNIEGPLGLINSSNIADGIPVASSSHTGGKTDTEGGVIISSVGIELDPKRAEIARMAISGSMYLDYIMKITKHVTLGSAGHLENRNEILPLVRFVEGDAVIELNNVLDWVSVPSSTFGNCRSHVLPAFIFCCGVGFSHSFVNKLCDVIYDIFLEENKGTKSTHAHCETGNNGNCCGMLGCLFLFKEHPIQCRLYKAAKKVSSVTIGTSWMDEAPAMLLGF